MTRQHEYLKNSADDLASRAVAALKEAMKRTEIHNKEAFMAWKIKRLMIDAARQQKAETNRMTVWRDELAAVRGQRIAEEHQNRAQWFRNGGLSAGVIDQEDEEMAKLQAQAMVLIMPTVTERLVLDDRFFNPTLSITDISHKYKFMTPQSLANYLKKLLGQELAPGALTPVASAVGQLSLATARAFLHSIWAVDDAERMTNPVAGAMSYLELAATYSPAHHERAQVGLGHLRWIERHMPSQRGIHNKILHRLITAACLYVMLADDAKHDRYSDVGLHDDVSVVAAVQQAVQQYAQ